MHEEGRQHELIGGADVRARVRSAAQHVEGLEQQRDRRGGSSCHHHQRVARAAPAEWRASKQMESLMPTSTGLRSSFRVTHNQAAKQEATAGAAGVSRGLAQRGEEQSCISGPRVAKRTSQKAGATMT